MSETTGQYRLTAIQAKQLQEFHALPAKIRTPVMHREFSSLSRTQIVSLFSEYIELSNSVVENCHEAISFFRIMANEENPDRPTTGLNLPSIHGALNGVALAHGVDVSGCCDTCAFRLGSMANQSPVTTADAQFCIDEAREFLCHDVDFDVTPHIPCKGWARRVALNKSIEKDEAAA